MAAHPKTFDTLIIGAGLLGSSTAYHLARMGAKNIAVVDADRSPVDRAVRIDYHRRRRGGASRRPDNGVEIDHGAGT